MLELFECAQEYRGLAGELPTQDVAVLRLLLAVLHAVFERFDSDGNPDPLDSPDAALTRWKALWDAGAFPQDIIRDYLQFYEDRFYLFDPQRPFYQVAALKDNKKAAYFTAAKLNGVLSQSGKDPDNPQKLRLFPPRTGDAQFNLNYAEAARWLLHINAVDDKSASGKGKGETKRSTYDSGWLGNLGVITAAGSNLFETLLLNLVLRYDFTCDDPYGKTSWEIDEINSEEGKEVAIPSSPLELLTYQSRKLLLERKEDKVTGYKLLGGDFFSIENAFVEQMTVWRQVKKKGSPIQTYIPQKHEPSRQLWRDFAPLLCQVREAYGNAPRPGIVDWLSELKSLDFLPHTYFVRFHSVGIEYDSKSCSIEDIFSDHLSINAGLLSIMEASWIQLIVEEINTTERLVSQVGELARKIGVAKCGAEKNKDRLTVDRQKNAAMEQAYFRLDEPFRRWLEQIDPQTDAVRKETVCDAWWEQERAIVRALGRELVDQAGPQAFTGRTVETKNIPHHYSAPEAYNYFLYRTASRDALKGGGKNE